MSTRVHEFDWPDPVVIGTVGPPGARTLYFQVRSGTQLVSVAQEKQQSTLLAVKSDEILDQLITLDGNPFSVPTSTRPELVDNEQLAAVQEHFRTGTMSLGWDPTTAQVVIEAYPITDVEADGSEGSTDEGGAHETEKLLVRMPVGSA